MANESKLVYDSDPGYKSADGKITALNATQNTYNWSGYNPATSTDLLTYTPTRMAKTVFNTYEDNDDFSVFCYFTDWAQYDGRIASPGDYKGSGRSADIMRLNTGKGMPFKRLIYSFAGLIGDTKKDPNKGNAAHAVALGVANNEKEAQDLKGFPIPVDEWGDVMSSINCGEIGGLWLEEKARYHQDKAKGLLGGFALLHKNHPDLEFSLSIGGWSMSGIFSEIAKTPKFRANFVQGIVDFLTRFPMFEYLDIDWEYPGSLGDGNSFSPEDGKNFATLIREIRARLPKLRISIAASADPIKLKAADIPALIEAGIDGINLMTYDFFTLGNGKLSHHSNLSRASDDIHSKFSVEDAVNYLLGSGVNKKSIFIGYAGYTRNAKNATLETSNPDTEALKGSYRDSTTQNTLGSFEKSVLEWTDIICNYIDFEKQTGRNGFMLYHDKIAKADYLYNPISKVFISLDTPRSVRDKARYVKEKGLGGLFAWSGDQDNGLLTNAAHEGLDRKVKQQVIDMSPFYTVLNPTLPTYTKPAEPQCEACTLVK